MTFKRFTYKWLGVVTALTLLLPFATGERAQAIELAAVTQPKVTIELDGYRLATDPEPMTYNGRTMVPFRAFAEALGFDVEWVPETRRIVAKQEQLEVLLQVGNKTATVNGEKMTLDAEPVIFSGRTMIPARFLSEAVGVQVEWQAEERKVVLTSQERALHTMVYYGLGSYANRGFLPPFDEAAFTWSRLDAEGHLVFDESEYQWPTEGADDLLQEVDAAGVDRSLMVFSTDEEGELTRLLGDEPLQAQFAADLSAKMQTNGFHTAVLDLETLGSPTDDYEQVRAHYAALVKRVADVLHANGQQLTVVVSPLNGWYKGYDYKALAASADYLYVMAYSYIEDKKPQPLEKIDEAIRLALSEVPADKVVLGINAYSETPETVRQKIGLAKRYDLYGVGFWILRVFDQEFQEAVDESLLMRPERVQPDEPETTETPATNTEASLHPAWNA
ncbi:MAG TPA: stalk domain-containing protein [Bacilli bacterium]|nr:stalk domain-containing protein [Bacilli bacterium]